MLLAFLLSWVSLRNLCVESGLKLRLVASVYHDSTNIISTKAIHVLHFSKKKKHSRTFMILPRIILVKLSLIGFTNC